ncbi:MAG: serine/threonine protein kinase [Pedosphaera sp.]|nr:serine/threonine protein kinase [Pedosphaera sp.]
MVADHKLFRVIGEGSGGQVWLASNVLGTYRAVKVVYASKFRTRVPFQRELNGILKFEPVSRLHDGLVDILQVGQNQEGGYFYYVMELADDAVHGRFFDPEQYVPRTLTHDMTRHRRLPIGECVRLGAAIASALGFLHRHGLIHRDIKPANIIFVNGFPKLADIGLVIGMSEEKSYVGTEGFIPQEGAGTVHADIYSLGKVLYEISTGLDRIKYPELPADLGTESEDRDLVHFNKIVLKACRTVPFKRFKSAEQMMAAILSFQFGASEARQAEIRRYRARAAGLAGAMVGASVLGLLLWRMIWLLKHPS